MLGTRQPVQQSPQCDRRPKNPATVSGGHPSANRLPELVAFFSGHLPGIIRAGLSHCRCGCLQGWETLSWVEQETSNPKAFFSSIPGRKQALKCPLLPNLRWLNIYPEQRGQHLLLCTGTRCPGDSGSPSWPPSGSVSSLGP